jgi:hypothetical protein
MHTLFRPGLAAAAMMALVILPSSMAAAARSGQADFVKECSACHMAYPPVLLPQRSWKAIMGNLSSHFGGDSSLDDATTKAIEGFLVANAADAGGRRSGVLDGVSASETPLRITGMPWFNYVHGQRARAYAKSHSKIKTISNCAGCHRGAEQGNFGDD